MTGGKSVFTGLKATTHFGRPQMNKIMTAVHKAHPLVSTVVCVYEVCVKVCACVWVGRWGEEWIAILGKGGAMDHHRSFTNKQDYYCHTQSPLLSNFVFCVDEESGGVCVCWGDHQSGVGVGGRGRQGSPPTSVIHR